MRLLLDTHALIWWGAGDTRLPLTARHAIDDAEQAFASAVSAMEIATKHRLGKLPEASALALDFPGEISAHGFTERPLTAAHAQLAGNLDIAHQDPFDRMLIAQALIDNLALVSNEALFDRFGVVRIW